MGIATAQEACGTKGMEESLTKSFAGQGEILFEVGLFVESEIGSSEGILSRDLTWFSLCLEKPTLAAVFN